MVTTRRPALGQPFSSRAGSCGGQAVARQAPGCERSRRRAQTSRVRSARVCSESVTPYAVCPLCSPPSVSVSRQSLSLIISCPRHCRVRLQPRLPGVGGPGRPALTVPQRPQSPTFPRSPLRRSDMVAWCLSTIQVLTLCFNSPASRIVGAPSGHTLLIAPRDVSSPPHPPDKPPCRPTREATTLMQGHAPSHSPPVSDVGGATFKQAATVSRCRLRLGRSRCRLRWAGRDVG